jgi:hypothetical protein
MSLKGIFLKMNDAALEVLTARNDLHREKWDTLIKTFFGCEPMLRPLYPSLFEDAGDESLCLVMEFAKGVMIYPFILRKIGGTDYTDIITAYGYGGPIYSGELGSGDKERFWNEFDVYARGRGAVSEFIRFSLFAQQGLCYRGELYNTASNIVCPLNRRDKGAVWMDFEHKVRKNVNRARSLNVGITVDETGSRLDEFLNIYYATMCRRAASAPFYFGRPFFEKISEMKGNFVYFFAALDGITVSAELVLISDENIYSFLGGTLSEYYNCRPNDLLKYQIIQWGIEQGKNNFVLGGGYRHDDGIFKYKKSFAPTGVVPYVTGRRILDPTAYRQLTDRHEQAARDGGLLPDRRSKFFPLYRAPFMENGL